MPNLKKDKTKEGLLHEKKFGSGTKNTYFRFKCWKKLKIHKIRSTNNGTFFFIGKI